MTGKQPDARGKKSLNVVNLYNMLDFHGAMLIHALQDFIAERSSISLFKKINK